MLWYAKSVFDYLELYGVMLLGLVEYVVQTATTCITLLGPRGKFCGLEMHKELLQHKPKDVHIQP